MIDESFLQDLYMREKMSVQQIADRMGCSQNKVTYWLQKYHIPKRSISDAMYIRLNPQGDPFSFQSPQTKSEWFLYGLGLGLFWGEGNKVNKHSVRLGNTDVVLIQFFLRFLKEIYQIDERKLRFGLQIFNDMQQEKVLNYWVQNLGVSKKQFQKVVVTKSVQKGTYRKKSTYGVLTIYFSNKKLRDMIIGAITELHNTYKPS